MAYGWGFCRFASEYTVSPVWIGLGRRIAPGSISAYRSFKQPRSEAIHGTSARKLDCFAALATTGFATAGRYARPPFPDVQLHIGDAPSYAMVTVLSLRRAAAPLNTTSVHVRSLGSVGAGPTCSAMFV